MGEVCELTPGIDIWTPYDILVFQLELNDAASDGLKDRRRFGYKFMICLELPFDSLKSNFQKLSFNFNI